MVVLAAAFSSLKRPGTAIGLVFTMFGLEQFFQTQSTIFLDRGQLVNMGVGFVTLLAASKWLSSNLQRFKLDRIQVAVLFLVLFSQLSQFWTIAPREFAQYYSRSPLPYYALYLLLAPVLSQGKGAIRSGVWTTLYIGIPLVFLIAFFVEWGERGVLLARPVMEGGRLRAFSPPLALASLGSYIAIMCVVLRPKNILWKLLHVVGFAMASYIVYRTQSRGQLIALGITVLLFYPIANQASRFKELLFTLFGFVVIGSALLFVFSVLDLGDINRWNEDSIRRGTEGRLQMVTDLIEQWSGSGPFFVLFGLGSAAGWKTSGFAVHNFPGEVLGELGLIGFSIYSFITITTLNNSYTIIKKLKHYPEMRREAVVLIAMYVFTNILSLKSISMFSSAPLMFYFAIAISQIEKQSRKLDAERLSWRRLLLAPAMYDGNSPNRSVLQPVQR